MVQRSDPFPAELPEQEKKAYLHHQTPLDNPVKTRTPFTSTWAIYVPHLHKQSYTITQTRFTL